MLIRFYDGSGDPKMLTVIQEKGLDGKTYIELGLAFDIGDDWCDCYHSFWLSEVDAQEMARFIQQDLVPSPSSEEVQ